jgi:hypothetical protein
MNTKTTYKHKTRFLFFFWIGKRILFTLGLNPDPSGG